MVSVSVSFTISLKEYEKGILTISGLLAGYADVATVKKKTAIRMHDTKLHAVNFMPDVVEKPTNVESFF